MTRNMNSNKTKLESLFAKNPPDAPKATAEKNTPPLRPCGCRTWFMEKEVCPYCGKRILRAVLKGKSV